MINQSPLNYTGGKSRLMPQLLPLFPQKINTYIDLFCGGCNVGINIAAKHYIYNDKEKQLIKLFSAMKKTDKDYFLKKVDEVIETYNLSKSSEFGYEHYFCESNGGLSAYNKKSYLKLRHDFNTNKCKESAYYAMLYVLIVYAFNNQIRFNSRGDFNLPVGKRDFNDRMRKKLIHFIDVIKRQDCIFTDTDFRRLDLSELSPEDFLYADPPYLITCATYNEQNGWGKDDEADLLELLETLDRKGIRVALSNVIVSKGNRNLILTDWVKNNPSFHINNLEYTYSNSNYHRKNKESVTQEVLITNY